MTLREFSDNVRLRLVKLLGGFYKGNDEWWGFACVIDARPQGEASHGDAATFTRNDLPKNSVPVCPGSWGD